MMREDWEVVESLLPANWQELGREVGALKGLRKNKAAAPLLRVLLLHLAGGYSLRETAARARLAGLAELSDVALLKRLRKCRDWLAALCVALFRERGVALGAGGGPQWRLFDATEVKEPGPTGSLWRVHYSVRLPALHSDFFRLTRTVGRGTGESFTQFPVAAGDYILADRGYAHARGLQHVAAHGGFVTVRINGNLVLTDPQGRRFRLAPALRTVRRVGQLGEWPVQVPGPAGAPVVGRVVAVRKSAAAIRQAQRRLRQRAQRKQQALRPQTRFLARYVIVFTTFPAATYPAARVLACYRGRWQVELVFKRFKQLAQLGHLPKTTDDSVQAWLYGKLLVALLTEKLLEQARAFSPWGYRLTAAAESVAGVPLDAPATAPRH